MKATQHNRSMNLTHKACVIALGLIILTPSCKKKDDVACPPNILLIIADDMGKDATYGFAEGSIKPNTPNMNAIKNQGLSFNNFWTYPTCSPTRASIISGKYGYRTGVLWADDELGSSETILQRYIEENSSTDYATAVVGKWHLAGNNVSFNPETLGMDHYAGLIRGAVQSFYQWQLTEDGLQTNETTYSTEKFTDLAIEWVNAQEKPWFLWLAYNAPHTPFHVPPAEMHSQGALPEYVDGMDAIPYYMAAIEAMDYQIGRFLTSIPQDERENTIIIFMGDNGTPNLATQFPYSPNKVKGTLYQGGINVPLFVTGPDVLRTGEDDNLINSTDLFATIAELAGATVPIIHDSKSFKPLLSSEAVHRNYQYSEMNDGTTDMWTISNGQFKLLENMNGTKEFYDLTIDPFEGIDLLLQTMTSEQLSAKAALEAELMNIRN